MSVLRRKIQRGRARGGIKRVLAALAATGVLGVQLVQQQGGDSGRAVGMSGGVEALSLRSRWKTNPPRQVFNAVTDPTYTLVGDENLSLFRTHEAADHGKGNYTPETMSLSSSPSSSPSASRSIICHRLIP